jgi:hypothetical protein
MVKYQEFHLRDFSGGYDGLSSPETQADNTIAYGSYNVDLGVNGALRTRRGYTKLLTDADATWSAETSDGVQETLGLHEFVDPGNFRCLVRIARATANSNTASLFSSGDICIEYNASDNFPGTISATGWTLESSGGTAITIGNTGTAEQYVDFCVFRGRLYVACPGITNMRYISYSAGFTATTVTDSVSGITGISKPKGVETWYERVWAYMDESNDEGTYIYWTNTDGDTFEANNYEIIPGQGAITGMARLGRNMVVFKPGETFILSGGDDPAANLRVETLSREVGCIARRSIVVVESGVYWLSERGVMLRISTCYSTPLLSRTLTGIAMSPTAMTTAPVTTLPEPLRMTTDQMLGVRHSSTRTSASPRRTSMIPTRRRCRLRSWLLAGRRTVMTI